MARRDYAGGATLTTITAGINSTDLFIPIAASTGWPSGTNGKFYIVIYTLNADGSWSNIEKVLATSRSGLNITVASTADRGVDGTTAQTHVSGSYIDHCIASPDVDEPNAHINDTSRDDHTQYLNVATAAGSGLGIASRVLAVNVDGSTIEVNADAIRVKDSGITSAKIADGTIATADLADGAITGAKIATGVITSSKLAAGVIDASALLGANVITATELADNSVDTAALQANAVTTAKITDANITTAKILDANVTAAKLAAALPRGLLVAPAVVTTDQIVANSTADFSPGLACTVTVGTNRYIRLTFNVRSLTSSAANDQISMYVKEGATALFGITALVSAVNGHAPVGAVSTVLTAPSAGAHTYTCYLTRESGGSGTGGFYASAAYPARFWVEDIGGT